MAKKLLDQMRETLREKHYSYRTEETYVHWVIRFIKFHKMRHPKEMGERDVETFLTSLAKSGVKDFDFAHERLIVRGGKGDKDRVTLLPKAIIPAIRLHLDRVRALHAYDTQLGEAVSLPDALARKYPNAGREWAW